MALISSKLSKLVPFSCCALFLYDEDERHAPLPLRHGRRRRASCSRSTVTRRAGADRLGGAQPARRSSTRGRAPTSRRPGLGVARPGCSRRCVCPLVFNERFIGTLSVYHVEPAVYTDDHRRLLDRVSEQAAAVISNSIVFEQTQEDSLTDPLTGLPNTRFMFMHLTRELARAERLRSEVVAARDGPRRLQGDQRHLRPPHRRPRAARGRAPCCGARSGRYDICVRYAGDEFIVVLLGLRRRGGRARSGCELQQAVDELYFEARPGKRVPLGDQRRRGGLPARRADLRGPAGDRRQPDVPRQVAAEDPARPRRRPPSARPLPFRDGRAKPAAACSSAAVGRRSPEQHVTTRAASLPGVLLAGPRARARRGRVREDRACGAKPPLREPRGAWRRPAGRAGGRRRPGAGAMCLPSAGSGLPRGSGSRIVNCGTGRGRGRVGGARQRRADQAPMHRTLVLAPGHDSAASGVRPGVGERRRSARPARCTVSGWRLRFLARRCGAVSARAAGASAAGRHRRRSAPQPPAEPTPAPPRTRSTWRPSSAGTAAPSRACTRGPRRRSCTGSA